MLKPTIFDIETGPLNKEHILSTIPAFDPADVKVGNTKDPDKIAAKIEKAEQDYYSKAIDRAALSPVTGRVLAIGIKSNCVTSLLDFDDEAELLDSFWHLFNSASDQFAGFNIFNFDLPFLVKRSWLHKVPVHGIRQGRYWHGRFMDLRELWQLGDRQCHGSLDAICKFFGVPGKSGNGADFHKLFTSDRKAAMEYLKDDLIATEAIFDRMNGMDAAPVAI